MYTSIASLQEDLAHALRRLDQERDEAHKLRKEIESLLAERDECKHRLIQYRDMVDDLPGSVLASVNGCLELKSVNYNEAIRQKYPHVDKWFKEE